MSASNDCIDCLCVRQVPVEAPPPAAAFPSLYKSVVASSIGSGVAVFALNPITVIKVHLQKSPDSSIRNVISTIYLNKRMVGFWAGTPIGLLQSVPNTVIYMSIYERLKVHFASALPSNYSSLSPGLAGGFARVCCVTLMSPLEVLRTIQTGGSGLPAVEIVRGIHRTHGVSGFYRGWSSTIIRDAPFSAIYWFAFDLLRPAWQSMVGHRESGATAIPDSFTNTATFFAGATSSMLAALCTHPFDVLKTQIQVSVDPSAQSSTSRFISQRATLIGLYRVGGIRNMYRGLSMRLATVIPASAIVVTVYEYIKSAV